MTTDGLNEAWGEKWCREVLRCVNDPGSGDEVVKGLFLGIEGGHPPRKHRNEPDREAEDVSDEEHADRAGRI